MSTTLKPRATDASAQPAGSHTAGVVDIHAHIQLADYLALAAETEAGRVKEYVAMAAVAGLGKTGAGADPSRPLARAAAGDEADAIALRLRLMDAAGVRMQVLTPTLAPYFTSEDVNVRTARLLNDGLARLTRQHPQRFGAFISLPLPHIEASVREIRRGLDELGLAGVTLQCFCFGRSIADEFFEPLFREMNARKAVLCLQPTVGGLQSPFITDWGLAASAGPILEDLTIALHLMVKGIPVRYPDIRIIVPHLGGGLAGMLERLDSQMPKFVPDLKGKPSEMARRFWYDTVTYGSHTALRGAVDAFGADRLLPGSDFPGLMAHKDYAETFAYVEEAGLEPQDAHRILHENAARLLNI